MVTMMAVCRWPAETNALFTACQTTDEVDVQIASLEHF
jgi:hypothetical protein